MQLRTLHHCWKGHQLVSPLREAVWPSQYPNPQSYHQVGESKQRLGVPEVFSFRIPVPTWVGK